MGEHNRDIFSGHYFSIFKLGRERPLSAAYAPDLIIPMFHHAVKHTLGQYEIGVYTIDTHRTTSSTSFF